MSDQIKCGIITYHFAANYGAVLQCYALKKFLIENGIKASVLNYISDVQRNNNSLYRKGGGLKGLIKNAVLLPFHKLRMERGARFKECQRKYIIEDQRRIISIEELKKYIEENHFQYIISGSDQVWNPKIADFNESFFYPFNSTAKKIGYAVSVGDAKEPDLNPYIKFIKDFSVVSSRENTTTEVLSHIIKSEIKEVCDPVFLLSKEDWENISRSINMRKYLLCYFVKGIELKEKIRTAEKLAKELNLSLVILSARITKYNFTHKVVSNAGPEEFLSLFRSADYICTDSFHGTAFSLIFNKSFTTIELKSESSDGRKTNLLRRVGLLSRVHYLDDCSLPNCEINYEIVNRKLEELRVDSKHFLINCFDQK